jgi:5-methylcytosine-specific restriction endonuclease McrA
MLAEMAARLAGQKWKCAQCAAEYEPTHDRQKYCSDRCQNRYRHINRTKPGQYRGELIALCDVYRRDEGKCQLCGDPVDLSIRWPDPLSASLDHVVPQSKGGPHTFSNVQLAHLSCNSRKHNRTE